MRNILLGLRAQVSDEVPQDRRVSFCRRLTILNLLPLKPTLQVFLYRGGFQGSLVGYGENVRDGFPRTPLNKRTLLPHVRSFLELKCDQ